MDVIRSAVQVMMQELIEAEATAVIGAQRHERTDARTVQRNGHRPRTLSTTAGDLELAIPKLRSGSFFPSRSARTWTPRSSRSPISSSGAVLNVLRLLPVRNGHGHRTP